ncbi:transcriptional regulator MarR [Novacetimonas hansenii ATCC 23769]|uniref:Transcriptional regulator MarR n=3 Tax=Novacetimonas hansenii TaxID=436 RepID=D5QEA2_NOVHA|nr:transcriptional regulator MarR [Novacetimonas hansenii ATCC 23769]
MDRTPGMQRAGLHMTETDDTTYTTYDLHEQIGHLLRRAYQRHTSLFQTVIPDDHLTSVQFAVLATVFREKEGSLIHIGRITAIDHATLRGICSRLKQRGLINIRGNPDDRRERLLSLSEEGMEMVRTYLPQAARVSELTLEPLDACERIAALHVLRKLAE